MLNPLEVCGIVNKKLRMGVATDAELATARNIITDAELAIARKHYRSVVAFLRALNERRFDLFTIHLNDDLEKLDSYHEFRKRHKNEH